MKFTVAFCGLLMFMIACIAQDDEPTEITTESGAALECDFCFKECDDPPKTVTCKESEDVCKVQESLKPRGTYSNCIIVAINKFTVFRKRRCANR